MMNITYKLVVEDYRRTDIRPRADPPGTVPDAIIHQVHHTVQTPDHGV